MKDSLMPLLRIVIAAAVAGALAMPSVASAQVVSEVRQQVEAQGRLHAEDQVDVHARGHAEIEARSEIQLCHATGSAEGDAFVLITIDESAVEAHLKHLDIHGRADIIPAPPGGCPTVEGEASVEADADANAHGSIHANMGADGSIDLGIGLGDHEMITICHATASAEGAAFVRIEIDRHALQAHLEQHGEGDIVLAAGDECPTASGGAQAGGQANGSGQASMSAGAQSSSGGAQAGGQAQGSAQASGQASSGGQGTQAQGGAQTTSQGQVGTQLPPMDQAGGAASADLEAMSAAGVQMAGFLPATGAGALPLAVFGLASALLLAAGLWLRRFREF